MGFSPINLKEAAASGMIRCLFPNGSNETFGVLPADTKRLLSPPRLGLGQFGDVVASESRRTERGDKPEI